MAEAKEHVEKLKETKFNRQRARTDVLRENCTAGYVFTYSGGAAGQSEFHHIIPISAMQDNSIEPSDKLDFFHDCMAATTWDTNTSQNLIGLPTKQAYMALDRKSDQNVARHSGMKATSFISAIRNIASRMAAFATVPDLPCHDNDHPSYTEELIQYLKRQIWQPLAQEKKACNVNGKSIRSQLESASSHWRQFLVKRGAEHGGAAHCWVKRHEPGYDKFWYIPFSMNPGTPRKAKPPPKLPKKNQAEWLEKLFSNL